MPLPGLACVMMRGDDVIGGTGVSAFPTSVFKTISSIDGASHTATTPSSFVTVTGGSGSYSYSWARLSGDTSITALTPAAASTGFTANMPPDTLIHAVFRCSVTDTVTGVVRTVDVDVTLHHVDLR